MNCSIAYNFLTKIFILFIDFYRYFISPLKPQCCRFYPSCSNYARESLSLHGFLKGSFLSIVRIFKCHPFHPGGFDPVPLNDTRKQDDG